MAIDFTNLKNDLNAADQVLGVLKTNGITVKQAIGVSKGLEPILSDFGVTLPPEVHDVLALLQSLATP
jgi:hypothetical protein